MYAITHLQNISKQVSTLAVATLYLLHYVNFKVIMTSLAQLTHEQPLMHKTLLLSSPVDFSKELYVSQLAAHLQVEHNFAGLDTITNE